ncbi:MAG: hypothetical protein J5874_00550 [Oscillospiraceae bacterium]|nr:hypothetical protein [Oscillospiraceae bacterium]
MTENDTVKLLRECDAGIKMGVSSIEEVVDNVKNQKFRRLLTKSKADHESLKEQLQVRLDGFNDKGKNPNPIAQSMSWIKTNVKLAADDSDKTVADLITDGCNMGVKSLNRYLNQYKTADQNSKDITQQLITLEENLSVDIRPYL